MATQIQLRRGTADQWITANPILAAGELGIETDTDKFKIGNGVDAWNTRPYGGIQGPTGAAGSNGTNGTNGSNGSNGAAGADGADGADGLTTGAVLARINATHFL